MPRRNYQFGDKIHQKLQDENAAKRAARERSGKISPGKLGNPLLWTVLDLIGVPQDTDPYLLGKFLRGNDVEARAIEMLTSIPISDQEKIQGEWTDIPEGAILSGKVKLQAELSYRGGIGYLDIAQETKDGTKVVHEVKSVTKMAFDKVAASGRSKGMEGEKARGAFELDGATGEPYYHHAIQAGCYALDPEWTADLTFLHYLNADDYRLVSFELDALDYKEHIDKIYDDLQFIFESKQLPVFTPFLGWHKAYKNGTYPEFNDLSPSQMLDKLERNYPDQFKKFMDMSL